MLTQEMLTIQNKLDTEANNYNCYSYKDKNVKFSTIYLQCNLS